MFLPTNITLKLGDSGDFVAELQRRLSAVRCFNADAINGFFDGLTAQAVAQFQSISGIRADGVAGPETLRRLNGVISGDNSSTEDHKAAEEEKLRQQQLLMYQQQQMLLQQEQQRQAEEALLRQQQQQQQQAAYAAPQPAAYAPPGVATEPQAYAPAQPAAYAPAPAQPYAPPPPVMTPEMMAAMAMQHQAQAAPLQAHAQHAMPQQPQQQPPGMTQQQPPLAQQPVPLQQQPLQHANAAPQQTAPVEQAQAAPRGMVGRAMQYANEMVQKLANYFESKLPNHVIDEVKAIGHSMAKSGVREVPIPTGPEQQQGREIQGKGQQQGIQRG